MPKFPQRVSAMPQANNFYPVLPVFRIGLTCFLLAGLIGCGHFSLSGVTAIGANTTPIQELRSQTETNETVYIQGKVERQVPLLKRHAYLINDSTGKIWAITNQTNLQEGQQVVIKGKLRYRSIPLAKQEFGELYLEEQ